MAKVSRTQAPWKPGTELTIDVRGFEPVPKGSMRGFVVKGRAIITDSKASELKAYARDVRLVATREMDQRGLPCALHQPFELHAVFWLPRNKGHFGAGLKATAPCSPWHKPDVDKLVRGAVDPLTGVVFDDDSRIVRLVAEKRFADPKHDVGLWLRFRVLPATIREQCEQQQTSLSTS